MRIIITILLICFIIGFVTPASFWTVIYLSRLIVWMGVGFVMGYLIRGLQTK